MKKVLMGNHAVAYGVKLAKVGVISAYPITPQTQVVELLSEMAASGEFKGQYMKVESEHSAMASLYGASSAGARTFTATSSQGLAYMHEMLHWVSGARMPIVMANINRALGSPWILWTDQTDSLSQRDTGWIQFYCSNNQEILDTILMSYKISEKVMIPSMVNLDGFVLSHTYEPVDVPEAELVDRYLPPLRMDPKLDTAKPLTFGALPPIKDYFRLRRRLDADMGLALKVIGEAAKEFQSLFGRSYGIIEGYRAEDAEALLVTSGAVSETAMAAVDELRKEGHKAGNLRMRVFRPFPTQELHKWAKPNVPLAVVDRNYSPGHHGIFCEEIKAALYSKKDHPAVHGFIAGLGGGDITPELLKEIWHEVRTGRSDPAVPLWMEEAR